MHRATNNLEETDHVVSMTNITTSIIKTLIGRAMIDTKSLTYQYLNALPKLKFFYDLTLY